MAWWWQYWYFLVSSSSSNTMPCKQHPMDGEHFRNVVRLGITSLNRLCNGTKGSRNSFLVSAESWFHNLLQDHILMLHDLRKAFVRWLKVSQKPDLRSYARVSSLFQQTRNFNEIDIPNPHSLYPLKLAY